MSGKSSAGRLEPSNPLSLHSFGFFFEDRDHILEIVHNSVIGDSEDRSARVFVDSYDRFGTLHGCHMLEGAADADGDVNLRLHGLSRDPNLSLFG